MTALAVPTVHDVPAGTSVRPLALIEAKRFARHPLFLIGAVMCAIFSYGHHGPEELDYHVIPSFFIGVLGMVVAARLTASTGTVGRGGRLGAEVRRQSGPPRCAWPAWCRPSPAWPSC